jgi:hypothetical protein
MCGRAVKLDTHHHISLQSDGLDDAAHRLGQVCRQQLTLLDEACGDGGVHCLIGADVSVQHSNGVLLVIEVLVGKA